MAPERCLEILLFSANVHPDSIPVNTLDVILDATEFVYRKFIEEGKYPKLTADIKMGTIYDNR